MYKPDGVNMNELYTGASTGTVPSNLTNMDYTINGFSIKDTILAVLMLLNTYYHSEQYLDALAQEITDVLATKLRLKQG